MKTELVKSIDCIRLSETVFNHFTDTPYPLIIASLNVFKTFHIRIVLNAHYK